MPSNGSDDGQEDLLAIGSFQAPEQPQHTSFLDLTNGEGGSKKRKTSSRGRPYASTVAATYESDSEDDGGGGSPSSAGAIPVNIDPSTPGSLVDAGQEATGRWTRQEHEAFMSALRMYGKEWKKVAAKVKTRTVVQTRTHAQKYFQKLHKVMETGDQSEVTAVEMGVAVEVKKSSDKKRKKQSATKLKREQSTSSTHAAAHLMGLSNSNSSTGAVPVPNASFGMPAPVGLPTHGFSTQLDRPGPSMSGFTSSNLFGAAPPMSITAPEHDLASRQGKYPEPSPAATGKRKLAEIAAAQMLAGVASSSKKKSKSSGGDADGDATPPEVGADGVARLPSLPLLFRQDPFTQGSSMTLQIVNPESLGVSSETRANRGGEGSPTTPWDGQLEALVSVSEAKQKGIDPFGPDTVDMNEDLVIPIDDASPKSPINHPVCEPGSKVGRSALHELVCSMDIPALEAGLGNAHTVDAAVLHSRDEAGFCPIHSAAALGMLDAENMSKAREIVRLLLASGSDVAVTDSSGNTPLHWAARAGDDGTTQMLLMKNCPPDNQNKYGETALHWAMRVGKLSMGVVRTLVENGAHASILNKEFRRPLDVALADFHDETTDGDKKIPTDKRKQTTRRRRRDVVLREIRDVRANLIASSNQCRTLVLHHPECLEHIPKSDSDWEAPDRVQSIMRRVVPNPNSGETTGIFPHEVMVSADFEKASLDALSKIHSHDYLAFVNDLSKELERKKKEMGDDYTESEGVPHSVPFTPMIQKSILKLGSESDVKQSAHSDTSFSAGSLRAARRAAGAVQHAVDCVLVGRHRNAFCVVRPPGHHAGIKGLLDGGESCGFCIFNNVATGALHAISNERDLCQRCAIVDIDVHHGNGTEEIVRKCDDPGKLLFFSIHLYDNDKKRSRSGVPAYKFYPGTGEDDDLTHNIINVPIKPLWKEQDSGPLPIPQNTHNTRQKSKRNGSSSTASPSRTSAGDDSSAELAGVGSNADIVRASDTDSETASKRESSSQRSATPSPRYVATGRVAYRRAIQDRLLPALRAYNPDLILISAGFDATKGDVGNAKHMIGAPERVGLDLEPEDYAWTTRKILEIADICCQGRVVSVLEGGYGRTSLAPVTEAGQPLDRTLFAEAGIRHLHALIDPYDAEQRFPSAST